MTYQVHNVRNWLHEDIAVEAVDNCIDGECSRCGSCCTNFLALSDAEIHRIKRFIAANNIKPCSHGFLAPLTEQPVDMVCPFRDEEKKICTIYEVRPAICEGYQCNRTPDECAMVMRKNRPDFRPEKTNYINIRLTFFGADDKETMKGQLDVSRMMAFKQKVAFGAHTDAWL